MVLKFIFSVIGNMSLKAVLHTCFSIKFQSSGLTFDKNTNSILLNSKRFVVGWYIIEIKLDSFQTFTNSYINVEHNDCKEKMYLPLRGGRTTRRIIRIDALPASMNLCLNESPHELKIDYINIYNAYEWLVKKLIKDKLKIRHINTEQDHQTLWNLYSETYTTGKFSTVYNNIYQSWIRDKEPLHWLPSSPDTRQQLISIILTSDPLNPDRIKASVGSIKQQVNYDNWEILYPEWENSNIHENPADYRIIPIIYTAEPRVSDFLNTAVIKARGDLILFMKAGSMLAMNALLQVNGYLTNRPDAMLLYSDDDYLDEKGERVNPRFKPSWNSLFFYCYDCVSDFVFINKKYIKKTRFREGHDGAEIFELILQLLSSQPHPEKIIHHMPAVLFHQPTVLDMGFEDGRNINKTKARKKVLEEYSGPEKLVISNNKENTSCLRIKTAINHSHPLVSVIIPTRDNHLILSRCLDSLQSITDYPEFEIIIVNNNSTNPESLDYYASKSGQPGIRIIDYPFPFNFSAINNHAVGNANGEVVVLLNDDTESINPGWLQELVSLAIQPHIGCVGAKLYYPNLSIQHGGVILGLGDVAGHAHRYFPGDSNGYLNRLHCLQYISAVTGACLAVKKSIYNEVDGLDEVNLTIAYNDVDFCLKVMDAGYFNVWTPFAKLYHYESISRGSENTLSKKLRYRKEVKFIHEKWGELLANDPYYHPFLTNKREDFSLRF